MVTPSNGPLWTRYSFYGKIICHFFTSQVVDALALIQQSIEAGEEDLLEDLPDKVSVHSFLLVDFSLGSSTCQRKNGANRRVRGATSSSTAENSQVDYMIVIIYCYCYFCFTVIFVFYLQCCCGFFFFFFFFFFLNLFIYLFIYLLLLLFFFYFLSSIC
jgi:hypothetical protein